MSDPLSDDPAFLTYAVDHTPTRMRDVVIGNAGPGRAKRLPGQVVEEVLEARKTADTQYVQGTHVPTPPTPLLEDMAREIASVLTLHTYDRSTADTLWQQFTLALTWKIHDAIHGIKPDVEDGEYAGYDPLREGARAAICGFTTEKVNGHPLL